MNEVGRDTEGKADTWIIEHMTRQELRIKDGEHELRGHWMGGDA